MPDSVCLDANVFLKLYVPEEDSAEAQRLVAAALRDGATLVGPSFLAAEVLSSLRKLVHLGLIRPEKGDSAAGAFLKLPVDEASTTPVYQRAWEVAGTLGLPVIYDSVYLAVAESRGATFWTADAKLFEKAKGLGFVRLLGPASG